MVMGLVIWALVSRNMNPLFLPTPWATWDALGELARDGTLWESLLLSSRRILIGWSMGLIIGIPLGLLMGTSRIIRTLLDPYIEFFRFIPPIAFVTLAIIWLGPGELSKVALIFYTTVFIVILNMIAGVLAVNPLRVRAAATLGASQWQILSTVIWPSTVPYMITGARIAMSNSFLTIVSAEMVAAQQGLGAMIWLARNYGRTEWVFIGIIALGLLGFLFDRVLRLVSNRFLKRYGVSI
ncbi:ABC transporter permease [Alcaligenaceae bacterium CGII-47]|nr:ABC transporter permease [Alcaligenaceae bacterium CGII-47]